VKRREAKIKQKMKQSKVQALKRLKRKTKQEVRLRKVKRKLKIQELLRMKVKVKKVRRKKARSRWTKVERFAKEKVWSLSQPRLFGRVGTATRNPFPVQLLDLWGTLVLGFSPEVCRVTLTKQSETVISQLPNPLLQVTLRKVKLSR